jgi:CRISPR/Cas system-associated protein endoribonuclease Cas2
MQNQNPTLYQFSTYSIILHAFNTYTKNQKACKNPVTQGYYDVAVMEEQLSHTILIHGHSYKNQLIYSRDDQPAA